MLKSDGRLLEAAQRRIAKSDYLPAILRVYLVAFCEVVFIAFLHLFGKLDADRETDA